MLAPHGLGEGQWGVTVFEDRVSVWEDEKFLEVDGADGRTMV